ncbi:alkaline phosphatase family protein [Parasphingorhabdus cellanae]|uniref:Alkaline phosphatase family protein n=1 Tax=Parasphingorhabdus cellanae TaxID=2806553 RepID=A0ABX7T4A4_9SPHN|nr:ectonucleotide pyrophosphatase/phosphodiesterase [Parasphingorhabdus cellanae]QTD56410.1 alkaline phosphatase family protein [Parasphingorhabdus cellanae]
MIRILLQAIAACALLAGCAASQTAVVASDGAVPAQNAREPVTLLISIDGFRPDYLDRGITPHLSALATSGVVADMRSSFPTKTFPNHWTLVTGKRPDNHGIVGNSMEDVARPGEKFTMANKDPFWWNQAEPIWITAEKQGVRTATMFWPGSEVELDGTRPSDWWPFSQALSNDRRVNAVVDWMRRPAATRPQLVTLYFDSVDTAGHFFGPAPSEKLHAAISAVDKNIGTLIEQFAALDQPVNFVITSDHGMAETHPDRVIYLDTILPRDQYRLVVDGNYAGIEPLADDMTTISSAFLKPHENMECWKREDIPARFQYGKNPRVPSIICLPTTGWVVYQDKPEWMTGIGGGHGYDHLHPDMIAFFLASGPGFVGDIKIETFDNVDIYSLLAHLIGVKPNQSDGDLSSFEQALKP